jgi:hypothetical protein
VLSSVSSSSPENDDYQCYLNEENPFESFEYIDAPSSSSSSSSEKMISGSVKVSLPEYGGLFHLSYVHEEYPSSAMTTTTTVPISAPLLKEYHVYQKSADISVKFSIYSNNPLLPLPKLGIKSNSSTTSDSGSSVGKFRKLTAQLISSTALTTVPFEITIENMKSIRRLMISINFSSVPSEVTINRLSSWCFPCTDNSEKYELLLEFDRIQLLSDPTQKNHKEIKTECLRFQFLASSLGISFEQLQLSNAIGELSSTGANQIMLRIPYTTINSSFSSSTPLASNSDLLINTVSQQLRKELLPTAPSLTVSCKFCDQLLLDKENFQNIHVLPTGLLDDVSFTTFSSFYFLF